MIEKYFKEVENSISYFENIRFYTITKKVYNERQGFISGTIVFEDESQLEFAEAKNVEFEEKVKYRYHYMDTENKIIFRYDNAEHHKTINTFPHHKHLEDSVIESLEPNLFDVLLEIEEMIRSKNPCH
jgi:hypothetical protein